MRVEERILDHESTLTGERVAMTLDVNATAHLMSVLTDLYSDPIVAVIREYSTNALDAHRVAGETRPIEVTLPSPLAPFFRVRDYGEGMTSEDVRSIYSRYGTSTKRESNDVVGMLGLGCKSALTYSDQFTLVATRDGVTVQVSVSRDGDGAGSMTIVSEGWTGDPNGVEVVIPTRRESVEAFARKSAEFFRYWPQGTVLVNGEAPARIDGLWLTDSLLLTREAGEDVIVQGNVPYPMLESEGFRAPWRARYSSPQYSLVAFVAIGEVTFTPSREALQATRNTKATLERVRGEAVAALQESCKRQIESAASPGDAVKLLREARAIGFEGDATYKGKAVPLQLDRADPRADRARVYLDAGASEHIGRSFLIRSGRSRRVNGERDWTLPLDGEQRYYFEGFTARELSPTKREKLAAYFEANGEDGTRPQVFAASYSADERYWLGAKIRPWSDVDAIKLERKTGADGTGRLSGSYDVMVAGTMATIAADDIDTSRPLYFANCNKYGISYLEPIRRGLVSTSDCSVVALPANRVAKFRRDFPTAVEIDEAARTIANAWLAKQSDDALDAYRFQRNGVGPLGVADASRFDDPALVAATKAAKRDVSEIARGATLYGAILPGSTFYGASAHDDALAGYPLASAARRDTLEHLYSYTNLMYAQAKDSDATSAPDNAATSGRKGIA